MNNQLFKNSINPFIGKAPRCSRVKILVCILQIFTTCGTMKITNNTQLDSCVMAGIVIARGYLYLKECNSGRTTQGEKEMCLRIKTGRYGTLHDRIYLRLLKHKQIGMVRKGRFGHEVIAVTMKTVGAEMRNVFKRTMRSRILVVGQPVVHVHTVAAAR